MFTGEKATLIQTEIRSKKRAVFNVGQTLFKWKQEVINLTHKYFFYTSDSPEMQSVRAGTN